MKILYVEDNPANLFLVKRVARMGNHEVINYIDGEEALRNFSGDSPDLILMDIELAGGMTGLDVVRKLREKGAVVPIVAVTAYAMVGDRERFMEAGCDDYIAKPIPIPLLVSVIDRYNVSDQVVEEEKSAVKTDTMERPALDLILEEAGQNSQETELMPTSPLQPVVDSSAESKPDDTDKPDHTGTVDNTETTEAKSPLTNADPAQQAHSPNGHVSGQSSDKP